MKTYKNLYPKLINDDNIRFAIKNASKGKKNKEKYLDYLSKIDEIKDYIVSCIKEKHEPKEIYDGISRKKRVILVPTVKEQIVHHAIINIIKPIILKGMYEQAYGSIPKKGVHSAKKYVEKWIKYDCKNVKYCLKMDIKKYFPNISICYLKEKLNKIIKDDEFKKVVFNILDVQEKGLPLGFYTSQWLAMWNLQDFDHYVKEQLYAPHYIRYMDDMVIFGANKKKLAKTLEAIKKYLSDIGLELNNRTTLFRFDYFSRDLDFMGFRFFRNKTILRKSIMLKMTRKAKRISKKDKITVHDARQMLTYKGWLNATDSYNVYIKYIKPYVNFKDLQKIISNYDKKRSDGKCGTNRKQETRKNHPK